MIRPLDKQESRGGHMLYQQLAEGGHNEVEMQDDGLE